ncbi:transcription factor [Fusarium heterosporum]|uniref:Transcription factor n=1 Tax=Fusarium heterosporum TaxID=42747 RepID=A0A8H5T201_FUSHE|nr:transcription factor [Fusarium heterosporum]
MSNSGLSESIWAINGRSRINNYYSPARSASQPTSSSQPQALTLPLPTSRKSSPSKASRPYEPPQQPSLAPATSSISSTRLTPAQAFNRFEQACQRLRWKFVDLQTSYHRALNPLEFGFTVADAERNFKVDFHEFYVWIEQALVLLLLVFGITVPRGFGYGKVTHAYHHEVLVALETPSCPVHEALGKGEANQALRKAKELRNKWKDASDGKETPPLKMYDLNWLVGQILGGLEVGYGVAARMVEEEALNGQLDDTDEHMAAATGGDGEWDWMVEPMDWEAA